MFWLDLLTTKNLNQLIDYQIEGKKIGHTSSQAMTLLKLLATSIKFGYGVSPSKNVPIAGFS